MSGDAPNKEAAFMENGMEEFGPNLVKMNVTDQIKELQTVLRDK